MERDVNGLVIDEGGRGHALFCSMSESLRTNKLLFAPGNAGVSEYYRRNVKATDKKSIVALAKAEGINLVVVGPEAPLIAGLADDLQAEGVRTFGPSAFASELEGSKIFTKTRCRRWDIPTADFDFAGDFDVAVKIIKRTGFRVIKADGLCAGKGVVVADSEEEVIETARQFLVHKKHGEAGSKITIEERLRGRECSMMFLCDGVHAIALPIARDYKRAFDGDMGSNTGGTGAYSPVSDVTRKDAKFVLKRMILPTLRGMAARGTPFKGLLYAGIMLTEDGPKLIEYNVRFGDPETQVVLPRIASDIVPYLIAATEYGGLAKMSPVKIKKQAAVAVVLMSDGYPGSYETGFPINGADRAQLVYHAGTRMDPDLRTGGGRVLNVVGIGETIADARESAYTDVQKITFKGMRYRTDIAKDI
jgi:phosphoribosylamine---glycine ligase